MINWKELKDPAQVAGHISHPAKGIKHQLLRSSGRHQAREL
nr:hypothetical protein [Corynebacterium hindlerae]